MNFVDNSCCKSPVFFEPSALLVRLTCMAEACCDDGTKMFDNNAMESARKRCIEGMLAYSLTIIIAG